MQPFSIDTVFTQLAADLGGILPKIPIAIITALVGFIFIRIISWVGAWFIGLVRMPKGLRTILISIMDLLLGFFLIITVLQALGLNDLALVLSAGIAGAGIAFGNGFVSLVADVVSGISLANDRDFSVGDIVRVGKDKVEGEVVGMDMRRTRIRTVDGQLHSFPNMLIERDEFVLITKKRNRGTVARPAVTGLRQPKGRSIMKSSTNKE
jgi:small-conductance mechanosensitive channel